MEIKTDVVIEIEKEILIEKDTGRKM